MSAGFTPGPWEVVEATAHHGYYVTSNFGSTICDFYTMSRPDLPSTINGGISHAIPFLHEMAGPNARLTAAAPELLAALKPISDCIGLAEWADAKHAEAILTTIIENYHGPARAAIAKATGAA